MDSEEQVKELANAACLALTALLTLTYGGDRKQYNALALRLDAALSVITHDEHGKATRG